MTRPAVPAPLPPERQAAAPATQSHRHPQRDPTRPRPPGRQPLPADRAAYRRRNVVGRDVLAAPRARRRPAPPHPLTSGSRSPPPLVYPAAPRTLVTAFNSRPAGRDYASFTRRSASLRTVVLAAPVTHAPEGQPDRPRRGRRPGTDTPSRHLTISNFDSIIISPVHENPPVRRRGRSRREQRRRRRARRRRITWTVTSVVVLIGGVTTYAVTGSDSGESSTPARAKAPAPPAASARAKAGEAPADAPTPLPSPTPAQSPSISNRLWPP
ncbi:hypothetical protein STENM327S_07088 [Streptomyces tendae]